MANRPLIFANPVAWILMTGQTTEHYDSLFENVKEIVKKDQTADGPVVELNPSFIYADAELAIRNAAANQFLAAELILCYFHLVQSWRRTLVSFSD